MKRPDNHSLVYHLILFSCGMAGLTYLQTRATDLAKTLTPDALRIGVTYLVFALSLVVLVDLLISHLERNASERRLENRLSTIEASMLELAVYVRDLIEMTTKTGPIKGFLISAKTLLKEESNITEGEVWVYSPDLSVDKTDIFSAMIAANINRGITYRYFLPNVPSSHADFNNLTNNVCTLNSQREDQVREHLFISWLPADLSRPGGMTIHVQDGASRHLKGFATIPSEKWGNDFFIRMDSGYAARALHYLRELDDKYGSGL